MNCRVRARSWNTQSFLEAQVFAANRRPTPRRHRRQEGGRSPGSWGFETRSSAANLRKSRVASRNKADRVEVLPQIATVRFTLVNRDSVASSGIGPVTRPMISVGSSVFRRVRGIPRRHVPEPAVRVGGIVAMLPIIGTVACIAQRSEPMCVEKLSPDWRIERFDIRILCCFSGLSKEQLDAMLF